MDHFSNRLAIKMDAVDVANIPDYLALSVGCPPVQSAPFKSGSRKASSDMLAQEARVTCNENHLAPNSLANPLEAPGVFHVSKTLTICLGPGREPSR